MYIGENKSVHLNFQTYLVQGDGLYIIMLNFFFSPQNKKNA